MANKNPATAALLSFLFTGAGQLYNGQVKKFFILLTLQFINVLLCAVVIGFFTYIITWFWSIYDAYKTAEKLNVD